MESDPWSAIKSGTKSLLATQDSKLAQLETAKRALRLVQGSSPTVDLCLAAADGDIEKLVELAKEHRELVADLDDTGLSPLVYAVAFDHENAVTLLLDRGTETLNSPDSLFGYTPLMWAVYLNHTEVATELLNYGADPKVVGKNGITVYDLVKPGSEMASFFEQHGLKQEVAVPDAGVDFYKSTGFANADEDEVLMDNIRLQTAGINIVDNEGIYQDSNNFIPASTLFGDEFNFSRLLKNQYIIFSDFDIPALLDVLFALPQKYQHKTTYPAALIYQCVRYADHMKDNDILVENFLNLAFTQIRSNTASKTGITSVYAEGDIVLQSYWLSVVNFLFYYLCRDDGFFKRYPRVLQELITLFQSLIIELSNSIKFRLNNLVDDCLLNYTSLPDITSTLYKSDWNFFKRKHQPKSTYEEIFQMLYPPSVKEQLKPSPIKIIQTFGALLYVLDLHHIHPLITQQTLSVVFYWLGSTLFNRIISQKKHLSRAKAIQIRLNISVLEDWARSNDRIPHMPDLDMDLLKSFPYTLLGEQRTLTLTGIAMYSGNAENVQDSAFYHSGLYSIVKFHLEPLFELLQWLQCLSGLQSTDGVSAMVGSFTKLNGAQLWRALHRYRYEVDEVKVDKKVRKIIENSARKENAKVVGMHYSSEDLLYLNQDWQFPVALPHLLELVSEYGAGLGGLHKERALEFQPFLPLEVLDSVEEIHEQKTTLREQEDEEQVQRVNDDFESNIVFEREGDLFGQLRAPQEAHKWDDNPW